MNIIFFAHILVIVAVGFLVWKQETSWLRRLFWPAFTIKLLAGVGVGLMYVYYYSTGDTFSYFEDASRLAALARHDFRTYLNFLWSSDASYPIGKLLNFQQSRALFLSKIASVFSLVSLDNYWIISGYFSLISFVCAWFLVKEISRFYASAQTAAVIAFLFFPSVVFWTSGLIKESLAMAGIYFLVTLFIKAWNRSKIKVWQWITLALAVWIVLNLKYYYFAVLSAVAFASLVFWLLIQPKFRFKNKGVQVVVWFIVFLVPLWIASLTHPNFYPERFLNVIVENYDTLVSLSNPEDVIYYDDLEPTLISVIRHSPKALFSGLFRPLLWEVSNPLQFFMALENTLLFVLFISALTRMRSLIRSTEKVVWLPLALYIVLLCVFLALSTPNFGTFSRYRVGFLPFFVLLITCSNPIVYFVSNVLPNRIRKRKS